MVVEAVMPCLSVLMSFDYTRAAPRQPTARRKINGAVAGSRGEIFWLRPGDPVGVL
jgi:hypothetical protein